LLNIFVKFIGYGIWLLLISEQLSRGQLTEMRHKNGNDFCWYPFI